ncbi:MAG: ATP-binding protein [Opitutaceae bacterium]|nr:ATP-binding protein [Opitutaceae bacterium]
MKRWYFVSGLTVILVLLMTLGGFSIWTSRALTHEIQLQISTDYDSIRALRELRTANTHINAAFLAEKNPHAFHAQLSTFEHERGVMLRSLDRVIVLAKEPNVLELVARLQALVNDYLRGFETLLTAPPRRVDALAEQQSVLAGKSSAIADVVEGIVKLNEIAIFQRRDRALNRGRQANLIALGLVFVSLGIYGFTSIRLTQGVYQPLARLRDSIIGLRERKFAEFVPVESTDELGQIAVAFNGMATEIRTYIAEQDERVVKANRISRAMLEALPKPIYIVNSDLGITLMNARAARLSDLLGVPSGLPSVVRRCIDEAAAKGVDVVSRDDLKQAVEVEWEVGEKGAQKTYFLPQVVRMRNDSGADEGWAVLLVDVTNLRRLDDAKTKAISTLGHEVKTPVTGIRMTLHLLLEEQLGPLTADQRELLQAGRDDCERLLAVLQALLELARFESGRAGIKLEPTPVNSVLEHAEAMHGSIVKLANRELRVESFPDELRVLADPMHASRVLGNFLSNAAKYSDPGTAVLVKASRRADGFVRFSVINRSLRGLTEAEQAKVFEPFYRRSGENAEGAGLGLTIAREIASLHGGRVGVWSEDTLVEFFLDLKEAIA